MGRQRIMDKKNETTVNPIVDFINWDVDSFQTLERDESWKIELNLMINEIALQLKAGHTPENVTFKELYAKYPKVRCGARRLVMAAKKLEIA